jgi:hypothetical protein
MRPRPNPTNVTWKSPPNKEDAHRVEPVGLFIPPTSEFFLLYTDNAAWEYTDGEDIQYL